MASVFDFMRDSAPQLQTSKALIITDLQNDFCSPDGKLYADVDSGFVRRLKQFATAFRPHGHIIWVRSEYDSTISADEMGEDVLNTCIPTVGIGNENIEHKQTTIKDADATDQLVSQQMSIQYVDHELFLDANARGGPATIKNTPGAQYVNSVEHVMQPPDLHVVKHNYSAFHMTDLLTMLQCRLVTQIYICGALSNISVHATALDAASNGMQVTLLSDCLGYRSRKRHDAAIAGLLEIAAAESQSIEQLIHRLSHADVSPPITTDEASDDVRCPADYDDAVHRQEHDQSLVYLNSKAMPEALSTDHQDVRTILSYEPEHGETVGAASPFISPNMLRDAEAAFQPSPSPDGLLTRGLEEAAPFRHVGHDAIETIPSQVLLPMRALSKRSRRRSTGEAVAARLSQRRRLVASTQSLRSQYTAGIQADNVVPCIQDHQAQKLVEAHRSRQDISTQPLDTAHDSAAVRTNELPEALRAICIPKKRNATSLVSSESISLADVEGMMPGFSHNMHKSVSSFPEATSSRIWNKCPLLGEDLQEESAGSSIVYKLLGHQAAETVFQELKDEVQWVRMLHQTGEVPRLVCYQGNIHADGCTPVYRHPSDKTILITPWTHKVDAVRKLAEEVVGHELNHALIQLYRSGHDFISEHSDKTLDIVPGSNIVNVSFGAERVMRLRTKRNPNDLEQSRTTHRIRMPHDSLLIMSLQTNAEYLHGIKADKRRGVELSESEAAFDGQRISITFRQIGTFLTADQSMIWGQGATGKVSEQARAVLNGQSPQGRMLIDAFGHENQSSSLNWSAFYGPGSDVLHLS